MREILFRGQTRRKGEKVRLDGSPVGSNWVYGGIFPNNDGGDFAIIYQQEPEKHKFPVYADTVGQYTGLTDKNGKKIFEGDVIANSCGRKETVEFYKGRYYPFIAFPEYNCWDEKECEVIGNIHDNPELIGGEPE